MKDEQVLANFQRSKIGQRLKTAREAFHSSVNRAINAITDIEDAAYTYADFFDEESDSPALAALPERLRQRLEREADKSVRDGITDIQTEVENIQ